MSRTEALDVALAAATAIGLGLVLHLGFGDIELNLADEGYLWYGVQRVLAGDVPLRDFQAYDPGRYLWCAAFAPLFGGSGDGILGVRAAATVFAAIGLFCGLLATLRAGGGRWLLVPAGVVLAAWLFPRHKLFEPALAMMATWVGVKLLESDRLRTHVLAGVFCGACGLLARNVAVYATLACVVLQAFAAWRLGRAGFVRNGLAFALGVVAGYAPMLIACAVVPGFGEALVASVRTHIEEGTNLPKPWSWPWLVQWSGPDAFPPSLAASITFAYLLPPLAIAAGLLAAPFTTRANLPARVLSIAGAVMGAFFIHHAAVRSAPFHLAQAIHPVLLAAIGLPRAFGAPRVGPAAWIVTLAIGALSAPFVLENNPQTFALLPAQKNQPKFELAEVDAAGETMRMFRWKADYLNRLKQVVDRNVPPDDRLFIAPARPTFYPLLGKVAPTWGIYFFWPDAADDVQRAMIRDLEETGTRWALVLDVAVDDREDLRFRNSHPLVWDWLLAHFERVPSPGLPPDHLLLQKRD
jgi:hypothetical protein